MKQISNYYLRKLEQRDLLLFLELVAEKVLLINDERFQPTLNKFLTAVGKYRETLQTEAPSVLATQIDNEERNAKSVWAAIRSITDNLMAHYGHVSRATGLRINDILVAAGSPDRLSSAWLTNIFTLLIKRFETDIERNELQRVGLLDWVMELKRSNRRLLELGEKHYDEVAKLPPPITSSNARSRKEAEKYYSDVAQFVNAMSIYLNDQQCHATVDNINDVIHQAMTGTLPEPSSSSDNVNP